MAKKQRTLKTRSTSKTATLYTFPAPVADDLEWAEYAEWATLYEVFKRSGEDDNRFLLDWAQSVAEEAVETAKLDGRNISVNLHGLISVAVHHFLMEHALEFIEDPDAFRIPTEEEDVIVQGLLLSVEPQDTDD